MIILFGFKVKILGVIKRSCRSSPTILTTLSILFSIMYYLELHNTISIYCVSQCFPTNVKLVVQII